LPDLAGLGTPALVIAGEHEGAFGDMKRFAAAISARFEMLLDNSHVTAFRPWARFAMRSLRSWRRSSADNSRR